MFTANVGLHSWVSKKTRSQHLLMLLPVAESGTVSSSDVLLMCIGCFCFDQGVLDGGIRGILSFDR